MPPVNPYISRLKAQLKMAINRLKLLEQKQTVTTKDSRRQMAQLLTDGKEQSAKIRVENIIRMDINIELLEILELYCELLLARIGLLDTTYSASLLGSDSAKSQASRECDDGLKEAVWAIIYTAPKVPEIKELWNLRELFIAKYGKDFAKQVIDNPDEHLPERLLKKLSIEPPSQELVSLYLKEIAKAYNAPFSELSDEEVEEDLGEEDDDDDEDGGNAGEKVELTESAIPSFPTIPKTPAGISASKPAKPAQKPVAAAPKPVPKKVVTAAPAVPKSKADQEFEDLQKRFEALRRIN